MENATYGTITRQSGLMREMQAIAHNIANSNTTGYRREGVIFAEHVKAIDGQPSLSMATAAVRNTSTLQGTLTQTGSAFDLAIEGDGFFMVETPDGERLTRAGHFTPNGEGDLVTPDGHRVLDAGGAPIFIPPDAGTISIAADGTLSANGRPLTQIGLYTPADPNDLTRQNGTLFNAENGAEPIEGSSMIQGFLEGSNVNAVSEIARMIEVQRAYELGQNFLDKEDERIRNVLKTLSN
ncbi:flagellar hook-basal body complex protein [Parasulfitobacter algicola]|uniref:Flagellar basal-body rod protein FlgF n=1 Tax=Parasulfitobacter algicola TaxID=2614809 RepID=A0ABX2IQ38_9RHOB|nr:flagellar hook-basal body complex protein [Sulfitobacter algicola]NSX54675.1 flagellar hook-basal body complex protein [Sulfitobacter algicola]